MRKFNIRKATRWTAMLAVMVGFASFAFNSVDSSRTGMENGIESRRESSSSPAVVSSEVEAEERDVQAAIEALSFRVRDNFMQPAEIGSSSPDCEKRKTICEAGD